jgi:ABC-type sugar transport system ATPase subunit
VTEVVACERLLRVHRVAAGEVQALRGIDATFQRGVLTALVGPSGSGKSTLLRAIAGLDEPTGGRVVVDGTDLA